MIPFSLNIRGSLRQYSSPAVMGIINITPDSFFSESRAHTADEIMRKAEKMANDGADFIDIGAYSTRPGCLDVTEAEELRRLELGIEATRKVTDLPISVDTFRAEVARQSIKNIGADIINDISGGDMDPDMFSAVAELKAPYILMHMRGTPATMMQHTEYADLMGEILQFFAKRVSKLSLMGASDVIIDPGFGFSKTLDQNYEVLRNLEAFQIFKAPVLVGVSRKSMITKLLGIPAEQALEGTAAINTLALERGAAILRVHDVAPAVQAVKIYNKLNKV